MTPPKTLDWLAVEAVCQGHRMPLRMWEEKRAVVRFYAPRIVALDDLRYRGRAVHDLPPGVMTAGDVAMLMDTSTRSVQRIRASLRPAVKSVCPRCSQPVWLCDDGSVDVHPTRWNDTCDYGGVAAVAS